MGPCSNGGWTSERASAVNGGGSEAESTLPGRGAVRVDSGRYAVAVSRFMRVSAGFWCLLVRHANSTGGRAGGREDYTTYKRTSGGSMARDTRACKESRGVTDASICRPWKAERESTQRESSQRDACSEHARCFCCTHHLPRISAMECHGTVCVCASDARGSPRIVVGSEEKNP